jgi:hypothetical protein
MMLRACKRILKQMRSYQEMDQNIPTFGVGNVVDALADAISKHRPKPKPRSINLIKLESLLYRESGCIDSRDVPGLMMVIYKDAGIEPSQRLEAEAEKMEEELKAGY